MSPVRELKCGLVLTCVCVCLFLWRVQALCMAVIGNWAGGVVLFAVTLRDRRFISRSVEIAACGTPFAIYVLVVVYLLIKYDDAFNLFSLSANPVAILRAAAEVYAMP